MRSQTVLAELKPGSQRSAASSARWIELEDANSMAEHLPGWHLQYDQVGTGRFVGRMIDVSLGTIQVLRKQISVSVLQTGESLSELNFCFPIHTVGQGGRWLGKAFSASDVLVARKGHDVILKTPDAADYVGINMGAEVLKEIQCMLDQDLDVLIGRREIIELHAWKASALHRLLQNLCDGIAAWPVIPRAAAVRKNLLDQLITTLVSLLEPDETRVRLNCSSLRARRVVDLAMEYIRAHSSDVITISELCKAAAVSRRSLQFSFELMTGMGPTTCTRIVRLNAVRRRLREVRGCSNVLRVQDIAAESGFWHCGQFASYYKRVFGESPSMTLRATNRQCAAA